MIDLEEEVLAALAAGADAYCLKSSEPKHIVDAVRIAREGGAYFDPKIAHLVLARFSNDTKDDARSSPLTPRETEILRLISDGNANSEMAETAAHRPRNRKGPHPRHPGKALRRPTAPKPRSTALRKGYI